MLYLQSFTYNPFQENTYIIFNDNKDCWIVDPGMYADEEIKHFFDTIQTNALKPQAIINTHAHLDHIFGVKALIDKFNIPFYIHQKEQPVLDNASGSAMLFGFEFTSVPKPTGYIDETQPLKLGSDSLEVRFTPGHSPGSVIFYYQSGNWLIGGDVLFNGSIGRTDLPGGNFNTLMNSIATQLYTLPDNTIVHPGHGPATSIANEKQFNPFTSAQL
jgi:glyoxylase-like metal-dependent hydrolase (beta-lactamase superfamily II)